MPQLIRRTLLAVIGLFGTAGLVLAQSAPAGKAPPAPMTPPAPAATTPPPAPFPSVVAGCGAACIVACQPQAACCNTNTWERPRILARLLDPIRIGEGCANPIGCGNFFSERTFLFGSCRQFFNPGDRCGGGLFPLGFGRGCCGNSVGTGGLGCYNTCAYGSYLNR